MLFSRHHQHRDERTFLRLRNRHSAEQTKKNARKTTTQELTWATLLLNGENVALNDRHMGENT